MFCKQYYVRGCVTISLAVYLSLQLCTNRHGRQEVFVNLLVRKIIYDYMYPVDLENNKRSCEYSSIVVPIR
jgi:hypothetical protein